MVESHQLLNLHLSAMVVARTIAARSTMSVLAMSGASRRVVSLCLASAPGTSPRRTFVFSARSLAPANPPTPARPKGTRRPRRAPVAVAKAGASTTTTPAEGQVEYPPSLSVFLRPDPELEAPSLPLTASVARAAEEANKIPLQYLQIPLGVKEAPVAMTGQQLSKISAIKDPSKKKEMLAYQRKLLVRQMRQPYYYDLHSMRSHGGKIWKGPQTMIKENKALYFPDIMGVSLLDRNTVSTTQFLKGNVSVVSVLTSRLSSDHIKSFVEPNLEQFQDNPHFKYVQINLQQNAIKSYLVSLFLSGLRKETPQAFQPSYIFARQNMELLRPRLGLQNQYLGYVFLVDEHCRVRWAGCAFADQEERNALWSSVGVLLERVRGK